MDQDQFGVSATYAQALGTTLTTLRLEGVTASLPQETRRALADPHGQPWHEGQVLLDVVNALYEHGGPELVGRFQYELTRGSLSRFLRPLVKVIMTLTGSSPSALLSRIPASSAMALKGVTVQWDAREQRLSVRYPVRVPLERAAAGWLGVLRAVFELAGVPAGTVQRQELSEDGQVLSLYLTW